MSVLLRSIAPWLLPSIVWRTAQPAVHLTFDDGPHPKATPTVLKILKQRRQQAAFFLLGSNAERHPHLVRQIKAEGHLIGNHGMVHTSLFLKQTKWQTEQIERAGNVIEGLVGERPRLFRPPFGHFDRGTIKVVRALDLRMVMWSVDSKDFLIQDPQLIAERASAQARPGSILLLHDNDATAESIGWYLDLILKHLEQLQLTVAPFQL